MWYISIDFSARWPRRGVAMRFFFPLSFTTFRNLVALFHFFNLPDTERRGWGMENRGDMSGFQFPTTSTSKHLQPRRVLDVFFVFVRRSCF